MTKIYEALDNASKERTEMASRRTSLPSTALPRGLVDKLLALYQRLETQMHDRRCGIVSFAGAQAGDDSAKLLCEFAKLAAGRLNRRILLLAACTNKVTGQLIPGGSTKSWEEMAQDGVLREEAIRSYGDSSLFVSQMADGAGSLPAVLASPLLPGIFDALRQKFDMILIDSPSLERSSDAIQLAAVADGVVLVINAGKTRWQVVSHWMEHIRTQRGTVLGAIFNKRKDYIPHWLYHRL